MSFYGRNFMNSPGYWGASSTKGGDVSDTHQITGSLFVLGSGEFTGDITIDGTLNARVTDFIVSANTMILGDEASDTITINAATVAAPNGLNIDSNTFVVDASNNRVGIGLASPEVLLDVNGEIKATSFLTRSSRRYKTNLKLIENPLDKIMKIRGVHFNWKDTNKKDVGLIAEEVGSILPELVKWDANGVDAQLLDYPKLTALLVECIKELKKEIEYLKN